jgi:type VI secretion system secreted protein VgrG
MPDLLASFASAFTHDTRLLQLHFGPHAGIAPDTLLPLQLKGREAINDGYRHELTCLSADNYIPLKSLIGQPVAVSILTDSGDYRPLSGWVTEARSAGSDGGFARYALVVRDLFALLDLRVNNRVF